MPVLPVKRPAVSSRQDARGLEMLGAEIGDEGKQNGDQHLRLGRDAADAVQELQRLGGNEQRRYAGQDAHHDGIEKTQRGRGKGKAAGQCRRDGKAEHDQARGIVEQQLALQNVHQPRRNDIPVDDRGDGHRIGRRQHCRESESNDQRNARHQPVQGIAEADDGEEDEADGQVEDRPAQCYQLTLGRAKSITEQQRRNEHQQEQFRIDLDMNAAHRPCECGAYGDLQDRQRHPHQPHQRAGNGDEDEHDENEDGGLHGPIPAGSPDHAQS